MNYLILGGTGYIGHAILEKLGSQYDNVYVFSRTEEKHRKTKTLFPFVKNIIGDVRNYDSVFQAIRTSAPGVIINASAMKMIDMCEDFIEEAIDTNINGMINVNKALANYDNHLIKNLFISTDKAPSPQNSYGMTKALAERLHINAQNKTRHIHNSVRYGNILGSTGSIIPVYKEKLEKKQNLLVTHPQMTRFFLHHSAAVEIIFAALQDGIGKKIFIPKIKSANIMDLAECFIQAYQSEQKIEVTKIRPGEKMHEVLFSTEEANRIQVLQDKFVLHDIKNSDSFKDTDKEFSSGDPANIMTKKELFSFLKEWAF
jgi:UDP-glucose 4-epimerase